MIIASITDGRYSWFWLGLTLLMGTVINTGMWVIIAIMPVIKTELSASRAMSSLPYVLTMVGFAVANYVIDGAVDQYGVTSALIFSAVLVALGYGLATLSNTILQLSIVQLIIGFSSAVGFGPLIADISH